MTTAVKAMPAAQLASAAPARPSPPTLHPETLNNAIPEAIYHHHDPGSPHRIRPLWVRVQSDGNYQLKLAQPADSPRFHDDDSPCYRPELCPQGSRPALAIAVRWLTENEGWRLTRKLRPTEEGSLECRLKPPAGWL